MAEDRKKSFTKFLEEKGESGIKAVALDYATNDAFTTMEALAEQYEVSPAAISKIIRYAIVECVITYQMCIRIKEKAHMNQIRHITKGDRRRSPSDVYYDDLLEVRKRNVCKMRGEKVEHTLKFYLNNPTLSAHIIAGSLGFSIQELNIVLRNAIIFCIATDAEVNEIISIALSKRQTKSEKDKILKTFESYMVHRKRFAAIQAQIREVEFQLDAYDEFHFEEDGGQTKEDLEAKLKTLREKEDTYYEILL